MKTLKCICCIFLCLSFTSLSAQEIKLKKEITDNEIAFIQEIFKNINISDQKYRSYLMYETMDEAILHTTDSLMNKVGIKEGMKYVRSLNLSLSKEVKDSLNQLQNQIDLQNHMTLRGILETYGFIPESIIKEKNYVQKVMLLHPPSEWDVREFQQDYSKLLIEEVKIGRMPAKAYASFYDNMLCKILDEPQLYGTNLQFDPKSGKTLPPIISSLATANEARKAIGLPILKEGEFRLSN